MISWQIFGYCCGTDNRSHWLRYSDTDNVRSSTMNVFGVKFQNMLAKSVFVLKCARTLALTTSISGVLKTNSMG